MPKCCKGLFSHNTFSQGSRGNCPLEIATERTVASKIQSFKSYTEVGKTCTLKFKREICRWIPPNILCPLAAKCLHSTSDASW